MRDTTKKKWYASLPWNLCLLPSTVWHCVCRRQARLHSSQLSGLHAVVSEALGNGVTRPYTHESLCCRTSVRLRPWSTCSKATELSAVLLPADRKVGRWILLTDFSGTRFHASATTQRYGGSSQEEGDS